MITDEQIMQLAGEIGDSYEEKLIAFSREMIALAQQVKPLHWTDLKYAVGKKTETAFGNYYVSKIDALPHWTIFLGEEPLDTAKTEAEAIEAANADYQRRVLSCLVHGGGE